MNSYYFKTNKDILTLFSSQNIFRIKIKDKKDSTEINIVNNKEYKNRSLFVNLEKKFLSKISIKKLIKEKDKTVKIFDCVNKPHFNFNNLNCYDLHLNMVFYDELFFDENSFSISTPIIVKFNIYQSVFNLNNYKECIEIFPKIKNSRINFVVLEYSNPLEYIEDSLNEIIQNKNIEKAFRFYTLLELSERDCYIDIVTPSDKDFHIDEKFKLIVEEKISKQQLKDICENFESLQKHSIEF
jgi:hypothetical protein